MPDPVAPPAADPVTPPVPATPPTPAPQPAPEPKPASGDSELEKLRKELQETKDREAALVKAQKDAEEAKRQEELSTAEKLAEEKKKREELELKTLIRETRDELGFVDSVFSFAHIKGTDKAAITEELNAFKTALETYIEKKAAPIPTPGGSTPTASQTPASTGPKKLLAEAFGFITPKTPV